MRLYKSYPEALNEIKRDLAEMGTRIHPATVQDKNVKNDPDYDTLELQNYGYTILEPDVSQLEPTQPWADAEWAERRQGIEGSPVNPGKAWELRAEVWKEFITVGGDFDYSYSERLHSYNQVNEVIKRIHTDPDSRQLFISLWNPSDIVYIGGLGRVPCTLGYLIQVRGGEVHLTYLQRSADFVTHFHNDLFMSRKLQEYIAFRVNLKPGRFTHWVGSLHMFRKDAKGVF